MWPPGWEELGQGLTHPSRQIPETPFSLRRNRSLSLWGCSKASSPPTRSSLTHLVRGSQSWVGQGNVRDCRGDLTSLFHIPHSAQRGAGTVP